MFAGSSCAHHTSRALGYASSSGHEPALGPRVELLEPDDRDRRVLRVALVDQLVAELAGAHEHAADGVAVELGAVVEHELEGARR